MVTIYSLDILSFPILNQSVVPRLVLSVASWAASRFLRRQIKQPGIPISFRIFHSLLWSKQRLQRSQWSRCFLEFSCFFYDPVDVSNLFSGSSAFSKSSLSIWKFSIHVLLKPSLKDFEHYLVSMWNACSYVVVWTFFSIALLWD